MLATSDTKTSAVKASLHQLANSSSLTNLLSRFPGGSMVYIERSISKESGIDTWMSVSNYSLFLLRTSLYDLLRGFFSNPFRPCSVRVMPLSRYKLALSLEAPEFRLAACSLSCESQAFFLPPTCAIALGFPVDDLSRKVFI